MKKSNQILLALFFALLAGNSYAGMKSDVEVKMHLNSKSIKSIQPYTIIVLDSKGNPIPGAKVNFVDAVDEPSYTDEKGTVVLYYDQSFEGPYFFVSTSNGYTITQELNLDGSNEVICN